MTAERSTELAVVALVLSVAAHIGLMGYMKQQVMAQVAPPGQRTRTRGPMEMRERPPEAENIRLDVLKDLAALKESPAARAEGPAPVASGFEAGEAAPAASAPELNAAALALPIPEVEASPQLSERFTVQAGDDPSATPIAPLSAEGLAGTAEAAAEEAPPEEPAADRALSETLQAVEVPTFDAPDIPRAADDLAQDEGLADLARPVASPTEVFRPEAAVMPTVDERVVEAEKAAVRDLLDVRRAADLDRFVKVGAASAQEGDWVYFRVRFDPGADLPVVPKDVVVLMDASGSIGNDRLKSCREAARKILRSCTNTGDRFNLVAFRDRFSYAFKTWQECGRDSFARADKWLGNLAAHGRTDVFATIRSVLTLPRDPSRPLIAVVVTDGDANAGVSETAQILSKFTALNDGLVSVYMYGVRETANRELLDVLTHGNRGESFIYGGRRWHAGSGLEALAERFRDPVLSDLRVVFTTDSQAEVYPQRLRNLYRGEGVDLVGRAPAGTREVSFSVKGLNGDRPYEGFFTVPLGAAAFDADLPGAWRGELDIDRKLR